MLHISTVMIDMPSPSFAQTLVLDQHYRPFEIVDWKTAITNMFRGKIKVLVEYDEVLGIIGKRTLSEFPKLKEALKQLVGTNTESIIIKVPAVCVKNHKVKKQNIENVKYSRKNVLLRDNLICQYCNKKFPMNRLTIDHILPKCKGGTSSFENTVCACQKCNLKKANYMPAEIGMQLLTKPYHPNKLEHPKLIISKDDAPQEWHHFLK